MKIYLTEQGKQEIEDKISYLTKEIETSEGLSDTIRAGIETFEKKVYEEFLESATILPVYSNWEEVETYPPDNESQSKKTLELWNGVIIQPKQ